MNLFQEAKSVLDKDGKVNPLGPYGKQKLTGRETSAYFRRNKVKPGDIKKAVEVALDLGGAMDIASKEIKKFFGDKVLKAKEVQNALRYANEETFKDDLNDLEEGSFYGRDDLVKQFATPKKDKHKYIKLRKTDSKGTSGVSMKRQGNEKKIADYKRQGYKEVSVESVEEGFKPYNDKQYPRCVDFYIQFRGGKGDRITSPENKKDYETAKKMIDTYCRTNKIKQKPVYSTPEEGSSAYKVGLMIDNTYSKTSDYKDGKDLQPLYVSLSKLKTAEDHGGGWSQAVVKEETVSENADMVLHVDDKLQTNLVVKMAGKFGLKSKKTKISWSGKDGVVVSGDSNKLKQFMSSVEKVFKEETDLTENFRALAKHGMGTETPKSIKVGTEIDYYQKDGAKYMGKVTKMSRQSYTVRDDKTKKSHEFFYHDRIKAKQLLKKKDKLSNIIKKNTIKKGKFAGYMTDSVEEAQQGARQSVMDTYRNIWEEDLREEMITYRVKKMHPAEKKKFEQSGKMMGLKVTMNTNKQDTLVVMSGTKKKLRDFDSVARGKSSYGDPSTVSHFDEK